MITHKQLSLAEVFEDCQNKFDNDKYQFLSLLDETINLDEIVPVSFVSHFHATIVRDVTFYNKEFLKAHPDIVVEKKSDSPDEDKSLADSKALLPVLVDFFQKHPLIAPKTFLGDAAFDTIEIYKALFGEIGFEKAKSLR